MINPLAPYLSVLSFVVKPILKFGTAAVFIGIVMVALGYDPIGLAWGFVENTIRSAIPGV
ncbi:hypothetical protein HOV17_gp15 [Halorubrum pleomorphic virus 9]|uniref:Uncharacterized protein n=1 Tax=Halorubrum pleomorphic virus 9 TaxID=2126525 RepID=A0A3S7I9H7_9VIRU|nr:hypothetical protein HOV17_gp15 [Halorubrum pleomorphic virus 9]AVP39979.1 hypothetical protein [Halorubrum pleomorphic virus 9]